MFFAVDQTRSFALDNVAARLQIRDDAPYASRLPPCSNSGGRETLAGIVSVQLPRPHAIQTHRWRPPSRTDSLEDRDLYSRPERPRWVCRSAGTGLRPRDGQRCASVAPSTRVPDGLVTMSPPSRSRALQHQCRWRLPHFLLGNRGCTCINSTYPANCRISCVITQ